MDKLETAGLWMTRELGEQGQKMCTVSETPGKVWLTGMQMMSTGQNKPLTEKDLARKTT